MKKKKSDLNLFQAFIGVEEVTYSGKKVIIKQASRGPPRHLF